MCIENNEPCPASPGQYKLLRHRTSLCSNDFFSLLTGQNLSDKAKYLDPKASGVADYDYRADLYG